MADTGLRIGWMHPVPRPMLVSKPEKTGIGIGRHAIERSAQTNQRTDQRKDHQRKINKITLEMQND